jgi:hypothetical protein
VARLEDLDEHAVGAPDRQQVQHDRLDRDHDRAERDQEQQERERQHEGEDDRRAALHQVVPVARAGGVAGHVGVAPWDLADGLRDDRVAQVVDGRSERASLPLPLIGIDDLATCGRG